MISKTNIPYGSCDHTCQTLVDISYAMVSREVEKNIRMLQSSPGYLQVGHVPSKWTWQIPQTSSSGISHRHVATVFHRVILTFMRDVVVARV